MALKNQVENVSAASSGVRNDFDPFHTPETALQIGRNVINIEGSLRPRMAHSDLGIVVPSSGSDVDDPVNLALDFLLLMDHEVVMLGKMSTLDDLSTLDTSTAYNDGYVSRHGNYQYKVAEIGNTIRISRYLENSLDAFIDFNEGYHPYYRADVVNGYFIFANEKGDSGVRFSPIRNKDPIDAPFSTIHLTDDTRFVASEIGEADDVLIVTDGAARLLRNGVEISTNTPAWLNRDVVQRSILISCSSGYVIQAFVNAGGEGISVYAWESKNGVLGVAPRAMIEGTFYPNKPLNSAPGKISGENIIWTDYNEQLWSSSNDGVSWDNPISITKYSNILGIYDSKIYVTKGDKRDVFTIDIFNGSQEPMAIYQFDADIDDKMIAVVINEDLYRLNEGVLDIIGNLSGTDPAQPTTRAARPVFRTFEQGGITYLVWTDVNHGVTGWASKEGPPDPYTAPESAVGVTGGVGIMVLANRLVKFGGVGNKSIEVDVSSFNDWKTGWGTIEVALLGDTPGKITGGSEISALQGAIFKEDAILHAVAQVEFGGVAAPFRFEQVIAGINGPPNPHCILKTTEGYSMFLGRDGGVYVYDGARVHDLGRHVRNMVEGKLDFMFLEESWGVFNPVKNLALFMFTSIGSNATDGRPPKLDRGVIVDAASGSAWEVTFGGGLEASCGSHVIYEDELTIGEVGIKFGEGRQITIGDFDSEDRMVMCGFADGRIGKQVWHSEEGNVHTDMGTAIDVEWETGALPFGALPYQFKTAHEAFHTFNKLDEQLSIRLNRYGKDMKKVFGATRQVGPGDFKTSHRETGRMFTVNGFGTVTRNFEYVMSSIANRVRGQR